MTRKSDLESYLKKNAINEAPTKERETDDSVVPQKPGRMTADAYAFRDIKLSLFLVVMFTGFFVSLVAYVMNRSYHSSKEEMIYAAIIIYLIAFVMAFVAFGIKYLVYRRWITNRSYVLEGWSEFLEARSADYWERLPFVPVEISVNLNEKASALEHEAVKLFMNKWQERWGETYSDLGFEGGTPDELKAKGLHASAHFSRKQLSNLTYTMSWRFLSLARLLGDSLQSVSIRTVGKEERFKFSQEKDDGTDRATSWQSRHES